MAISLSWGTRQVFGDLYESSDRCHASECPFFLNLSSQGRTDFETALFLNIPLNIAAGIDSAYIFSQVPGADRSAEGIADLSPDQKDNRLHMARPRKHVDWLCPLEAIAAL